MRKTLAAGEDVLLALLNYRNTPAEGAETSPAQRLLGRRTQIMILVTESALKPVSVCSTVVEWATHMLVYVGLSPTGANHRKELISALSCSLNDVK